MLLGRFGLLDHPLLLALGLVDLGVPFSLGLQHRGPFLPLGAHLLFHRDQDIPGRVDVLDLVAEHLDAPGVGRLVEFLHHPQIDVASLLERLVQFDLADLATQRRLRELGDGEQVFPDSIGSLAGVHHLQVEHAVHADLDVVRGDTDLLLDVDGLFLEGVAVGDAFEERDENVESRRQRSRVPAQVFDDVGVLLRHNYRRLDNDDNGDQGQKRSNNKSKVHKLLL